MIYQIQYLKILIISLKETVKLRKRVRYCQYFIKKEVKNEQTNNKKSMCIFN